jgi:hypothetical protein
LMIGLPDLHRSEWVQFRVHGFSHEAV